MKMFNNDRMIHIKRHTIVLWASLLILIQTASAQVVSLNGAYISTGSGTVINIDTIRNDATSTFANAGTFNLASFINAGTMQGNGTYNISSLFTNSGTFTANSSTVNLNGNSNQNIPAVTFNNLTVSGTGSTKTASGNISVGGTLTISSGDTIDLVTNTFGGTPGTITGTGTLKTQNTSTTPIPSGKTWTGPVYYNSSSSQYIPLGNYADLNGTGGARVLTAGTTGISGTFTPGSGAYTVTGTNIDFNGTGAQTIPAFAFNCITVSGGSTKTLGGAISILDSLTFAASTTLALSSYDVTLISSATATARIANTPSSAAITYGNGKFIVQRYVPGRRKYRLITSSVTTSTASSLTTGQEALSIWGNWQNSGNNVTANVGNFITGGSSADGFDQQTVNASLYTYDDVNKKYVGFTTANGKNTKYTPLKAGIPYYMFVYGDRLNTIFATSPHPTVLSARGTVLTGDQTYTTSSTIPLTGVTNRFTMLGNPFASPIDWALVSRTNIANTFWGWDPNLTSTGGYVTVSTTGTVTLISPFSGSVGLDQYIQPGQGFFVKTTGSSPAMTIHESDKVSNFNSIAFRGNNANSPNSIPLIAVNLQYTSGGNTILADGTLAAFDNSFSNNVGNEDGTKIVTALENVSIILGPDLLSIDARKMPVDLDTIFLNMTKITKPQYTLQLFTKQMQFSVMQPILEDTYLNSTQAISLTDTTFYPFSVVAGVPASSAVNRFRIVFHDMTILPIHFTSINAVLKGKAVEVDWKLEEESNTRRYEIERSQNGISFTKIGAVTARGSNGTESYQWLDGSPQTGNNFYRIRAVNADGKSVWSPVAQVKIDGIVNSAIKVFPNPVKDKQVNLQLVDMKKGDYTIQVVNAQGQQVSTQNVTHLGGTSVKTILVPKTVPSGIYYLKVMNNEEHYVQTIYIE